MVFQKLDKNQPCFISFLENGGVNGKVLLVILSGMKTNDNIFTGTIDEIAFAAEISHASAQRAITFLLDINMVKKVRNGGYMVNPRWLAVGSDGKLAKLYNAYDKLI